MVTVPIQHSMIFETALVLAYSLPAAFDNGMSVTSTSSPPWRVRVARIHMRFEFGCDLKEVGVVGGQICRAGRCFQHLADTYQIFALSVDLDSSGCAASFGSPNRRKDGSELSVCFRVYRGSESGWADWFCAIPNEYIERQCNYT
jgi:hypothetical protein